MILRSLARLAATLAMISIGVLFLLQTSCGRRAREARRAQLAASMEDGARVGTDARADRTSDLSDAERKAAARAAFAEGIQLQEHDDCARALPRFESAQRLYDAPTHLLHIAQCQASTGRLVEAQESYASLSHLTLNAQAPRAFREAQDTARAERARLEPRVPTLRLEASPPGSSLRNLVVQVNGKEVPAELLGVARPVNPGRYHVTMSARGARSASGEVELKEGETKTLEVRLGR